MLIQFSFKSAAETSEYKAHIRRSVMVNDEENLGCVQQKQYWAQNTAQVDQSTVSNVFCGVPEGCPVERRRRHSRRWTDLPGSCL